MSSVVFIEDSVTIEQIRWGGHTNPIGILEVGKSYEVEKVEVHSSHTRVFLVGIKGYFNSIWFDDSDGEIEEAIKDYSKGYK